jgi:hypothetical protein
MTFFCHAQQSRHSLAEYGGNFGSFPFVSKGKTMRKTLGISLLSLLFVSSASAGEIPNWTPSPATTPTPTQPANTAQESTDSTDSVQNSLTESALDLLTLLSSLL